MKQQKVGLKKLQKFYSKPEKIPEEIKLLLTKKIEAKKSVLEQGFILNPNDTIKLEWVQGGLGCKLLKLL